MGSISQYLDPSLWGEELKAAVHGFGPAGFWLGVLQILLIDVLLSGDNAVVIAMACRGLPPRQRFWGMMIGVSAAVMLRIIFAAVITQIMQVPYLKLIGGVALLYIAVKLLAPEKPHKEEVDPAASLWGAVRIVIVADVVMSLDNILPVAAAARGNLVLLAIGLAGSIPLILVGAAVMTRLLQRFPVIVWLGSALLGWIAGEVMATDPFVLGLLTDKLGAALAHQIEFAAAAAAAILVVVAGAIWRRFA